MSAIEVVTVMHVQLTVVGQMDTAGDPSITPSGTVMRS